MINRLIAKLRAINHLFAKCRAEGSWPVRDRMRMA